MARKKLPRCFYCSEETFPHRRLENGKPHPRMLTKDHLVPISRGGGDNSRQGNKVVACFECNQAKRDLTYREYLQERGLIRFARKCHVTNSGPLADAHKRKE